MHTHTHNTQQLTLTQHTNNAHTFTVNMNTNMNAMQTLHYTLGHRERDALRHRLGEDLTQLSPVSVFYSRTVEGVEEAGGVFLEGLEIVFIDLS